MLAAKATRWLFDAHHLEGARVQSVGVCTQFVMSMASVRSNLMGRQRTDDPLMGRQRTLAEHACSKI